jgi:uncharacterized protein
VPAAMEMETTIFLIQIMWRAGGLMIFGMALFKWGILTAKRSRKTYAYLAATCFGIGIPVSACGVVLSFKTGWDLKTSMLFYSQFNYVGSLLIGLGYIGLIMFVCKTAIFLKPSLPFAAVGRTALTNYILQSVLCTYIFYGHGLGLYGKVERIEQIFIIVGIWLFQLIVSPVWLKYFKFGPVEWLWRSLIYLKFQPFKNNC